MSVDQRVAALYTPEEHRCRDCGDRLPPDAPAGRLYCERDRYRRRAMSYLKAARQALLGAQRITDAAEVTEMIRRLEVSR